jgi:hypothetical protein
MTSIDKPAPQIVELLIQQETMLLDKTESHETLIDLIDDHFIEIGSSAKFFNKKDVIEWLAQVEEIEWAGSDFAARPLADGMILLTYISSSITSDSPAKKAMRSSIWRQQNNKWRMIFHQGTPMKKDNS